MEIKDLDNKDQKLIIEDCELNSFRLTPKYTKEDMRNDIESKKLNFVTTGGAVGAFGKKAFSFIKGEKDDGNDVKVEFIEELSPIFWLVSGVYGCKFYRKGSEIKYTIPVEKNVQKIWVDGKEVPFSSKDVNLSDFMGKIISKVSIAHINLDGLETMFSDSSEKLLSTLGMQNKNITKEGKAMLPNVIEQAFNICETLLCINDENSSKTDGKLKKDIITSFKDVVKKTEHKTKARLNNDKIVDIVKTEIVKEPNDSPRKIEEQKLHINELVCITIPFYHFKVKGKDKTKNVFINSVTKSFYEDAIK
ncbi:MAG: hypothetical protein HY516_02030 [Candidatus Aenigmarchaeota archaeon]|nr:hypothetical protein [Candidatus Aenigmarchaeota archaeon]